MKPLTPSNPDNWLTQAKEVTPSQRIFTKCIYLGCGDSADNYREASEQERAATLATLQPDESINPDNSDNDGNEEHNNP